MAKKLGELLVESGLISADELNIALASQKESSMRLGEIIIELKMATEMDIVRTLSTNLGIPFVELSKSVIDPAAVELVDEKLARKNNIIPVSIDNKDLTIAMLDPLDFDAISDIRFSTGMRVKPAVTTKRELTEALDLHYNASQSIASIIQTDLLSEEKSLVEIVHDREGVDEDTMRRKSETPPIIRMVNLIISDAVKARASDIHVEPHEKKVLIRDRVDGILREIMDLPKWVQGSVVSRIKIMARMDISEKRVPQDGRVKLRVDAKEIDLRVSTLPTQYGEKVEMRLLDVKGAAMPLESLGFSQRDLEKVLQLVSMPQGVILITGPTGSGKTSTLYGILNRIKSTELNIITLEDPIEYEIDGISQVMIDEGAGLTFANGLRSCLRQDPNVIMVGEMRDAETAEIAMQASLTGHKVLSTIHTNDTTASITRLLDLGIQPYLISSSISGIIAQRLIRVICRHCRERYTPSEEEISAFGLKTTEGQEFFRGKGCDRCLNTGYHGRKGVYEILTISAKMREMISSRASEMEIRHTAIAEGMKTLSEDAMEKVRLGVTTIDEIHRVVYFEGGGTSICRSCKRILSDEFKICPYCADDIETICPKCGKHRAEDWIACPYCRTLFR